MIEVPLEAVPNQSLSIRLDDRRWLLRIVDCGDVMAADVTLDDVSLVAGVRIVAGTPIVPYAYLRDGTGNFILLTESCALPDYRQFGVTQRLLYESP